jgi:hypothetical protein
MALLWDHYVSNVDILIKILHKPTMEAMIVSSCKAMEEIDAPTEALLFGIYYAAVMTMSTEECVKIHGRERSLLLQRYGCALEHALARARLFTQQSVVLQAMILLIVSSGIDFFDYHFGYFAKLPRAGLHARNLDLLGC